MGLKLKISILHIVITFVTLSFIYMIYDSYVNSHQKDIDNKLEKLIQLNKQSIQEEFTKIQATVEKKRKLNRQIHLEIKSLLEKSEEKDLKNILKEIKEEYNINEEYLDIELFIVNKFNKIIDSTNKHNNTNLQFYLKKSNLNIHTLFFRDFYSKYIFVDFLEDKFINYFSSKVTPDSYLITGFVFKKSINEKEKFKDLISISGTQMNLFFINEENKNIYKSVFDKISEDVKYNDFFEITEKFPILNQNIIIKASRTSQIQTRRDGDVLENYIPLEKDFSQNIILPYDLILQVNLDISEQNLFVDSILNKLVFFIILHFLLVFIIFKYTNKYQRIENKLNKQIEKNTELITYNKQFISNLVHQIRTPLAIVMTNISLLELMLDKKVKRFIYQINASINMLSNSYENLSYFITYENLDYPKRKVNVVSFIKERISFFDQIACANKKKIISNLESKYSFEINDIEFERLIDNSISNALYFCEFNGTVLISIKKVDNKYILLFQVLDCSSSKDIELLNKEDIHYMKDMSSLGLGLLLIKEIAQKNNIKYSFSKINNKIIMEYLLDDKYITKIS